MSCEAKSRAREIEQVLPVSYEDVLTQRQYFKETITREFAKDLTRDLPVSYRM